MEGPQYECYVQKVRNIFKKMDLSGEDIYRIANTLNKIQQYYGRDQCWPIESVRYLEKGFTCSHQYAPRYKGKNAGSLILAVYNIFPNEESGSTLVIRKSTCNNYHCINPNHLTYGDQIDLKIEKWRRNGIDIDKYKFAEILWEYRKNEKLKTTTYSKLAKEFNLSYNTIRSICNHHAN